MNANPFQAIQINWGSLYATSGEELSHEWCKKIAALEVRGCGFAGSVVATLKLLSSFSLPGFEGRHPGQVRTWIAEASCSLPDNAYGTDFPPMLYAMVQYGTRIYYKFYEDPFGIMKVTNIGKTGQMSPMVQSEFVTAITNLHYDTVSSGTTRWSFSIFHKYTHGNDQWTISDNLFETNAPDNWRTPFKRMMVSHWPSRKVLDENEGKNKVALRWYALGVDHNLVS